MNNFAVIGYALLALRNWTDWSSKEELHEFISDLKRVMDEYTEEEAEEFYRNI